MCIIVNILHKVDNKKIINIITITIIIILISHFSGLA